MTPHSAAPLDALAVDLGRSGLSGWKLWIRALAILANGDTRGAVVLIRLAQHFHARGWSLLARRTATRLRRDFGCMVSRKASIGPGLKLPHPLGIVIGEGVKIGANCVVYQQVTLGGARRGDWQAGEYPQVGDDVVIFAGAKLVGALSVGSNAVIGANAVVTRSVPPGHVAVGIPAVAKPAKDKLASTTA